MLRGKGGVEIFQTGTTRRNRRVSFADKSRADRIYYDIHAFTHTYVLKKAYIKWNYLNWTVNIWPLNTCKLDTGLITNSKKDLKKYPTARDTKNS